MKKSPERSHYDLKSKKPSYLEAVYPYKAVGEELDVQRLDDSSYIDFNNSLYELKCPNCNLEVHVRGSKLKKYFDILYERGCPECKLQFNNKTYSFKDGEEIKPLPENNGKYKHFTVKKVIFVPIEVFDEYALKLYNKLNDELSIDEGKNIAEEYNKSLQKEGK